MTVVARKRKETIRDTAANLAAANLVFPAGFRIIESDTDIQKEADGVTAYNSLPAGIAKPDIAFSTKSAMLAATSGSLQTNQIVQCDEAGFKGVWKAVAQGSVTDDGKYYLTGTNYDFEKIDKIAVNIKDFGAVCDGITNDREAVRLAVSVCAGLKITLYITDPTYIEIDDDQISHPIELSSNTNIVFQGAGKLVVNHDRLPVFYCFEKENINIDHPVVQYTGTHDTSFNQSYAQNFHDNRVKIDYPNAAWLGPAPHQTVFMMRGCANVKFNSPHFYSESNDPDGLLAMCIVVWSGTTSSEKAVNTHIIDPIFDGAYMPVLAGDYDGLFLKNIISLRYGILTLLGDSGTTEDGWFPPPHIFYGSAPGTNLVINGVFDAGIDVGGGNWGQTSLKPLRVTNFQIANVVSFRDHGLMDFSGSNGAMQNLYWKGDATKANYGFNGVRPFRWLPGFGSPQYDVRIDNLYLEDISTDNDLPLLTLPTTSADRLIRCSIRATLIYETYPDGVYPDYAENCDFNIDIESRQPVSGTKIIYRINQSDCQNNIKGRLRGFGNATPRVITKEGSGSYAELIDEDNQSVLNLGSRVLTRKGKKRVVATLESGASVTLSGMIPAGSIVFGVNSTIEVSIGTSNGTTGYRVGTATDPDRWGVRVGTAAGGTTRASSWTDSTIQMFPSATNIVITADGGNFDGTGQISVTVDYLQTDANTDMK